MKESKESRRNSVYYSHPSSGNQLLGLVSENELHAGFKLNCMFFEDVSIMIVGLLGGTWFSKWSELESEAHKELFSSKILRPVMRKPGPITATGVANQMVERNTKGSYKSIEKLLSYASFIDSSKAGFHWTEEVDYRETYKHTLLTMLNTKAEYLSEPSVLKKVISYIHSQTSLYTTELWKICDATCDANISTDIKKMSEFAAQFAQSSCLEKGTELSTPQGVHDQSQYFHKINPSESEDRTIEEIECDIPLDLVAELPLEIVLALRNTHEFREFRSKLSRARVDANFSLKSLENSLQECRELLFMSFEKNKSARNNLRRWLKTKDGRWSFNRPTKLWISRGIVGAGYISTAIGADIVDTQTAITLLLALFSYYAGRIDSSHHLERGFKQVIAPAPSDYDYLFKDGRICEK